MDCVGSRKRSSSMYIDLDALDSLALIDDNPEEGGRHAHACKSPPSLPNSNNNHHHQNNVSASPTTSSVHELLECPVCTNSMYPPIHQFPCRLNEAHRVPISSSHKV